ncbi:KRE11-like protein [Scheffersomyces xylosifermentans]|uniref:KRE11-like protein n=1 Tax=Scheffersomyces xylosifermentans TaxID=1304137 RepID=UPI00315D1638
MSVSIVLPSQPEKLHDIKDLDKLLFLLKAANRNRKIVFFDEAIVGYIIFTDKDNSHQGKTSISLDGTILPADIVENQNPEKYISAINNFRILDTYLSEDDIVLDGYSETEEAHCRIWKFEVPITYPRRKFSNPILFLSCVLHDNDRVVGSEVVEQNIQNSDDEALPDYVPGRDGNLLSEMNYQELVTAENSILENSIVVNQAIKATIRVPVSVSLVIRIKSTKPAGRNNILLATLNIESSEEFSKLVGETMGESVDYYFTIKSLLMDFKFGEIKEIKTDGYDFPLKFRSQESINLTYRLINNEFLDNELKNVESNNLQFSRPVNIKLVLQVQKFSPSMGSYENISGTITTAWSPYLDFSIIAPPINNSLKTSNNYSQLQSQPVIPNSGSLQSQKSLNTRKSAVLNNIYKSKSPNPNIYGNHNGGQSTSNASLNSVATSSVTVNLTTGNNSTLAGLKLNFKGKLNVKLGEVINWKIQAINNSPNRLNLSLLVQNPINFNPIYSTATSSSNVSSSNLLNSEATSGNSSNNDIIVYNKLQLYSMYNTLKMSTNGIIILNNDIRIGPLDSNTVFETDIKLIGISKGIFNLDGIKIFDINSGDGLDFGKLVEVFVI